MLSRILTNLDTGLHSIIVSIMFVSLLGDLTTGLDKIINVRKLVILETDFIDTI